jgi:hypothetical protein
VTFQAEYCTWQSFLPFATVSFDFYLVVSGPPHSVSDGDMRKNFGASFTVTQVHSDTSIYEPRMKAWNLDSMTENAFIITK